MTRRRLALAGAACAACAVMTRGWPAFAAGGIPPTKLGPDEALARLLDGNHRFVADEPRRADTSHDRRHTLAAGQAPFAAILGCADSRTAPEAVFDTGLGELFVARVAGNTATPTIQGSFGYAVGVLHVPLILVLGHEKCGAVNAAVEAVDKGTKLPGALGSMIEPILPAATASKGTEGDRVGAAVKAHALAMARQLREGEPAFATPMKEHRLRIIAAHYALDSGEVSLLES